MKSKLILSAVVAASIALSGSVFAGPKDGPSAAQVAAVYNHFCGDRDHQKLASFVKANVLQELNIPAAAKKQGISESQGRNLCDAVKKMALAQKVG